MVLINSQKVALVAIVLVLIVAGISFSGLLENKMVQFSAAGSNQCNPVAGCPKTASSADKEREYVRSIELAEDGSLMQQQMINQLLEFRADNQNVPDKPAGDPFSQDNCGKNKKCPTITIICMPDNTCVPGCKECTIQMPLTGCAQMGYISLPYDPNKVQVIKKSSSDLPQPGSVPPGTTWKEVMAYCLFAHENIHAQDGSSDCPNCGSEKNAYANDQKCYGDAKELYCGARPVWTPTHCNALDIYISQGADMQEYMQCLCDNRIPGTWNKYAKGTCSLCFSKIKNQPNPQVIADMYCTGNEHIVLKL